MTVAIFLFSTSNCNISRDLSPCLHMYIPIRPGKMFIAMLVYDAVRIYITWHWFLISRTRAALAIRPFYCNQRILDPTVLGNTSAAETMTQLWMTRVGTHLENSNFKWCLGSSAFRKSGKTWKNPKKEFSQSLCLWFSQFWNRIPIIASTSFRS